MLPGKGIQEVYGSNIPGEHSDNASVHTTQHHWGKDHMVSGEAHKWSVEGTTCRQGWAWAERTAQAVVLVMVRGWGVGLRSLSTEHSKRGTSPDPYCAMKLSGWPWNSITYFWGVVRIKSERTMLCCRELFEGQEGKEVTKCTDFRAYFKPWLVCISVYLCANLVSFSKWWLVRLIDLLYRLTFTALIGHISNLGVWLTCFCNKLSQVNWEHIKGGNVDLFENKGFWESAQGLI